MSSLMLKIIVPVVTIILSIVPMEVIARWSGETLDPPEPLTSYLERPWGSVIAPQVAPEMVNKFGTFDRDHTLEKPAGIIRIATLGDSFLGLPSLPHAQQLPQLLEERLNAGIPLRYEVLNFSVSSAGTVTEYLRYKYDAHRFAPDITLVFFTISNDARNNSVILQPKMEACPIPLPGYVLDDAGNLQSSPMLPAPGSFWYYRDPISAWLVVHSALFRLATRAFQIARGARAAVAAPEQWRITASFLTRNPNEVVKKAWDVTEALIVKLKKEIVNDHGRFGIVIIPTSWDIDPTWKTWLTDRLPDDARSTPLDFDAPYEELIIRLQRHKIAFLDLRQSFRDRFALEPNTPLYDETGHWSPAGHQVAADATTDFVRKLISPIVGNQAGASGQ